VHQQAALAGFLAVWAAMCAGMMLPTALRPARRLSAGRPDRWTAFLVAYALAWASTGAIAYPLLTRVPWNGFALMLAWIAVGCYQALPATSRRLRSCRRLSPDQHPFRTGLTYAWSCVLSCLPLMLVAMATMHAREAPAWVMALVMGALTGFVMWSKTPAVPVAHIRRAGLAMVAIAALAFSAGAAGVGHDRAGDHRSPAGGATSRV